MTYFIKIDNTLTPEDRLWCIHYIEKRVGKRLKLSDFTKQWLVGKYDSYSCYPYIGYPIYPVVNLIAGYSERSFIDAQNKILVNQLIPRNRPISIF